MDNYINRYISEIFSIINILKYNEINFIKKKFYYYKKIYHF